MKMPDLSLTDKAALVTGASGGIGSAIAGVLGAAGAKVFVHGYHQDKLEKVAAELRGAGVQTGQKAIDITVSGAPRELVDAAISEMGGLDILVKRRRFEQTSKTGGSHRGKTGTMCST